MSVCWLMQQEVANRLTVLSADYLQQLVALLHTHALSSQNSLQVSAYSFASTKFNPCQVHTSMFSLFLFCSLVKFLQIAEILMNEMFLLLYLLLIIVLVVMKIIISTQMAATPKP